MHALFAHKISGWPNGFSVSVESNSGRSPSPPEKWSAIERDKLFNFVFANRDRHPGNSFASGSKLNDLLTGDRGDDLPISLGLLWLH